FRPRAWPFQFSALADTRFSDYKKSPAASFPKIRQALLRRIAEEKQDFVVIAGDIVYKGAHEHDWRNFDEERQILGAAGVRVFPALGGHDLEGGSPAVALNNYFARFPELGRRRWYSVQYGPVYLLMLDSQSPMDAGSSQGGWLRARLDHVPEDVDYVVLVLHHPSYTRSSERFLGTFGGGHKARSQEKRLAQLLEERSKTLRAHLVQVAGHVHNYERYTFGGVQYIVNGGGGSPAHTFSRSSQDAYNQEGPTFGLGRFTVDRDQLTFEMWRAEVASDRVVWSVQDSLVLKAKP
ncbi:MAG: metallophosphoesterase, partial [Acidobacteria bacterium]|nr:metallophosphoesterase [Acidobacteriota bacterium]